MQRAGMGRDGWVWGGATGYKAKRVDMGWVKSHTHYLPTTCGG